MALLIVERVKPGLFVGYGIFDGAIRVTGDRGEKCCCICERGDLPIAFGEELWPMHG